jgi:small subunit ribosomal protein S9
MEVINALGRRKTAVARIYMKAGSGNITVNKRDYKEYFPTSILHYVVEQPMMLTETLGQYDIKVNLDGGGINGQAEALRLAISRALCENAPTTASEKKLLIFVAALSRLRLKTKTRNRCIV